MRKKDKSRAVGQIAEQEVDGRVQRSVRSRERILEALVELVQEGELQPTGEQVATRAGVGLRTVFRHFEDMESLYAEIQARLQRLFQPLLAAPLVEGGLRERASERMAPFKRSDRLRRWKLAHPPAGARPDGA